MGQKNDITFTAFLRSTYLKQLNAAARKASPRFFITEQRERCVFYGMARNCISYH